MQSYTCNFPQQRLTTKEKLRVEQGDEDKVPRWIKENRRYLSSRANEDTNRKEELRQLYRVADQQFDPEDYKHLTNPYATEDKKYQNYPAKLRNYSIIAPIVDRLMGERRKRPNKFQVVPVGANVVTKYKQALNEEFKARVAQNLMFSLQAAGVPVQASQPAPLRGMEEEVLDNFIKEEAANGQTALEILNRSLDLPNQFQAGFYDFLVTGEVYDFKSVNHDDVEYQIVSPLQITIIGWDERSQYAEDATAQVRRMNWSVSSIIDTWREKLRPEDIDWLLGQDKDGFNSQVFTVGAKDTFRTAGGQVGEFVVGNVTVEHGAWKSLTKRGTLYYQTELGVSRMPVDDTYVLDKKHGDIKIDWFWENEWWEYFVVLADNNPNVEDNVLYLDWGTGKVQRTQINNTSSCKLPHNGLRRGYRYNSVTSPVKTGIPYENLINSLHYRFDLALARSYDKLMLFPIGLIPKQEGWSPDRWMYSIRAFSIAFFDETKEKALAMLQGIKEIDMSMSQYMSKMWELLQVVKHEYWDAIGFNPQRYGDLNATSGKATTEIALSQASTSTNEMVAQYETFREKALQGLLDYSKFAWIEGKQGALWLSDNQRILYEINGIEHAASEEGVFVVDPIDEEARLSFFKQAILQPMAQNGADAGIMADIVNANDFGNVQKLAKKAQEIQRQYEMAKDKQEQDAQVQVAQLQKQASDVKSQTDIKVAEIRAQATIQAALITADSFNAVNGDSDGDGVAESQEIYNRYFETANAARTLDLKQQEQASKASLEREKINAKREDTQAKVQIAKENKNKFDK